MPLKSDGIVDEDASGITLIDEQDDVEPGMSKDFAVNLEPGDYVLICNIDSDEMHYAQGMHTPFTVK